jgi:[protein-PII] uridylyltransferase
VTYAELIGITTSETSQGRVIKGETPTIGDDVAANRPRSSVALGERCDVRDLAPALTEEPRDSANVTNSTRNRNPARLTLLGKMLRPAELAQFTASMPARYSHTFDALAIEQHARTARLRQGRPVNVGTFTSVGRSGTPLCVVAPDRPGLLALVSLAFVSCDLDVVAAEIFTRKNIVGVDEAVDLFWVRRQSSHDTCLFQKVELLQLRATLTKLLRQSPQELRYAQTASLANSAATGAVVRFLENADGNLVILEIETSDRCGLLLSLCRALFGQGVQIVGSRIQVNQGRIYGRFEIMAESHGVIALERRAVIKHAVISAVDGLANEATERLAG